MKFKYSDYELVCLAQRNDEEALNILVKRYSHLIGNLASSNYVGGVVYQEFLQKVMDVFIKAIKTFDKTSSTKFYDYALACIRNSLENDLQRIERATELESLSDNELVYLARQSNEEAINILVTRYSSVIGKLASSFYVVGYDHQDFLQEGNIAFVKAIETFDETINVKFYTYATTCVRNSLRTAFRKMKRKTELDNMVENMESIAAENSDQDYDYVERLHTFLNDKMIIEEALMDSNLLSDLEKQCLEYHLLDNNYKEIAIILGVSPKKVDNALNRCKNKLKKIKLNQ